MVYLAGAELRAVLAAGGMQFNVLFAKSLLARISPQGLACFVCVAMPAFAVVFDLHVAGTIHLSDQLLVVVSTRACSIALFLPRWAVCTRGAA